MPVLHALRRTSGTRVLGVIGADAVGRASTLEGVFDLIRQLGYPVTGVPLDREEWRRAGIDLPWSAGTEFFLAARLARFDLFVLSGPAGDDAVRGFLHSYRAYNVLTKSSVIKKDANQISIYDIQGRGRLRRLDVTIDSPTTHALDRLNLLRFPDEDAAALPRVFDVALDRETVSRHFFERFRTALAGVTSALAAQCDGEGEESLSSQGLLILSRLLFLSFVQEKGWLNGERRFLLDRLHVSIEQGREFFSSVLLPLFFGCLNTPAGERDPQALALGSIPYLNGGLFERSAFERRHDDLRLPNDLMITVVEGVFERFDFSVDENDSAGTHVDPEMLGKVFESLMAAEERLASGSFYTPRAIVDRMVRRAITEWLSAGDENVRLAISTSEWSPGDGGRLLPVEVPPGTGRSACPPSPSLFPDLAAELLDRLETITVLDPACGSGAFLLSAMSEIERLTHLLGSVASRPIPPDLRKRIVERSLCGVDLKGEATRLCELRLWLAIVSGASSDIDSVQPLPNLDRNILQGNSLLSPTDFLGDGRGDVYREWVYALRAQRDLIDRYRHAPRADRPGLYRLIRSNDQRIAADMLAKSIDADETEMQALSIPERDLFGSERQANVDRCRELHERIQSSRVALERLESGTLDFFSFDIHFAPVMANGGFDVIVGNPPWVRNARIDRRTKRMYTERYALFRRGAGAAGFHQPDLSTIFFERATSLVREGGVISLLLPAKIANAGYASSLRRFVGERHAIVEIADWSDEMRRSFDADTFPLALTVARRLHRKPVAVSVSGETFHVDQHALSPDSQGSEWALIPPPVMRIVRRLFESHSPLQDVLNRRPLMGVKTGDNRAFFLEAARLTTTTLITSEGVAVPFSAVCRGVRGRDVRRWRADASQWILWPPRSGWRRPPRWLEQLAETRNVRPEELRLAFVKPEHVGIKVAWKDVARGMTAAVLPNVVHVNGFAFPLIPNQTLYSIDAVSLDEAYLIAALLNSTIADALLLSLVERAKDSHYRYFGRSVARIPLPSVRCESDAGAKLVRLSRRAHQGQAAGEEVDRLVAEAYGVASEELEVLREFVARRLGFGPSPGAPRHPLPHAGEGSHIADRPLFPVVGDQFADIPLPEGEGDQIADLPLPLAERVARSAG